MDESITCPRCGMTSHSPHDVRAGWCGNCEAYTTPKFLVRDDDDRELSAAEASELMDDLLRSWA
jgi:NMD protein affecting ribosome stability and mRNA decay